MRAFGWFAAAIVCALTLLTLAAGAGDLLRLREERDVRAHLQSLAALTIRNFPDRDLDSPELFWQAIGREGNPMRDNWGTPYQLSQRVEAGTRFYFWTSAGPDRLFGTVDDIIVGVQYPNGPVSSPEPEGPTSLDAK